MHLIVCRVSCRWAQIIHVLQGNRNVQGLDTIIRKLIHTPRGLENKKVLQLPDTVILGPIEKHFVCIGRWMRQLWIKLNILYIRNYETKHKMSDLGPRAYRHHTFFLSRFIITINTQRWSHISIMPHRTYTFIRIYTQKVSIYHPLIKLRIYCTTYALCMKSIKWWSREIIAKHLMVMMGATKRWHCQWISRCPPQILKKP